MRGPARFCRHVVAALCVAAAAAAVAQAEIGPAGAALYLDMEPRDPPLRLHHGAERREGDYGTALEFTQALQYAEVAFAQKLDGIESATIGGWFLPRRSGEQAFLFRGMPEIAAAGERLFRPQAGWVNFLLGTDQRGFFLGTIHGNGTMPFPHVTINELGINRWHQLVVVKTKQGHHRFYHNGMLIHTDENSASGGKVWPFRDEEDGEPVRLAMPLGGLIGEVWIFPRELSAAEVRNDFEAKADKYHPAAEAQRVRLREMNRHHAAGLWKEPIDQARWPQVRKNIHASAMEVLGPFPESPPSPEPQTISEVDCGNYVRRKISIQVQPGDSMPAYLLIPKRLLATQAGRASQEDGRGKERRAPAILCFYGTTSGAGKETTVGLSGRAPGTPPHKNLAFAVDVVEAGFVALAADYLRDGERISPGKAPYDTTEFYEKFPEWSLVGKDVWDNSRAIDYLQTLDFVDPERIGMVGHSYGGHSTIFAAALEPRIQAAVANGPVSDFLHHGLHWAVPKGAGNSQSLPGMRPYVLDPTRPAPLTFYEFTALIAPRPLLVGQAVGERRPMEEENYAAVRQVYEALGHGDRVHYHWYAGDHDFPPVARAAAVEWFRRWLDDP